MGNAEAIVYGCIRDTVYSASPDRVQQRREVNRQVLAALPGLEEWPLLAREMFAAPLTNVHLGAMHTDVVHFGSAYQTVEYEWEHWMDCFESMLRRMYWVSATVHLETELSGLHTFTWQSEGEYHHPGDPSLALRCEWVREGMLS